MKIKKRSIVVEIHAAELSSVDALCNGPAVGCDRDEVAYEREVDFGGGFAMLLQAVATGEPETHGCWTQGVLFEKSGGLMHEIGCTEPGDLLSGEHTVFHDDCEYTVRVLPSKR